MTSARGLAFLLCAAAILHGGGAAAATTTDEAAALVTYPLIAVEPTNGVDTFVQLINDGDTSIDVRCFLDDQTRRCADAGSLCLDDSDCPPADTCALPVAQVMKFDLTLTQGQPISWQASSGRATLPLPGNSGSIPPVPALPFHGVLRCLAVEGGTPSDRNVLRGAATLERFEAPQELDRARYNAVGNRAIPGAPNQDTELVLGGPNPEYEGCANALLLDILFDHTIEPVRGDEVLNTLTAVPCSGTLDEHDPQAGAAVMQFLVYNEFEQQFSTSRAVDGQMVRQLSRIDTDVVERSIFSAGVVGTPGGRIRFLSFGAGVIAMNVERHRDRQTDARFSAALDLATQGERSQADVLFAGTPLCPAAPRSGCVEGPRASLKWTDRSPDTGDRFHWQFARGGATDAADLGQPQTTTSYAVCVYGGTSPSRFAALAVPAGAPSWSTTTSGLRYADRNAEHDGVRAIQIRTRGARTRLVARGRGEALPDVDLATLAAPVIVQLSNDAGGCWESRFDGADILRHDAGELRAKGND